MHNISQIIKSNAASFCSSVVTKKIFQKSLFNSIRLDRPEFQILMRSQELRFISYCLSRRDWSKSQIMQDLWVCFELGEMREGYFVEFGATNGKKNSNTWLLETRLGWKGVLAEPNPIWHSQLAENRRVFIDHRCVSSQSDQEVVFITTDDTDPELSAIAAFSELDHFAKTRSQSRRIQVKTISLDDLLNEYQAPYDIDYISIDTEGNELEIIRSYSFKRRFKTISVEKNRETEDEIDKILISKGYTRVFPEFSQWDSWYVSDELKNRNDIRITAPMS